VVVLPLSTIAVSYPALPMLGLSAFGNAGHRGDAEGSAGLCLTTTDSVCPGINISNGLMISLLEGCDQQCFASKAILTLWETRSSLLFYLEHSRL